MAGGEWQEGVDMDALTGWMDEQGLESGAITGARLLVGGTQNLIVMFTRGARRFVLRRPAAIVPAGGNETIRREIRVLAALAGSDVPHPALIAACPQEDVLGAAFYLMEPVDGFNVTVGMPPLHASDPAIRRAMGFALVDGIARLAKVDHVAVGLGDFGRVEGYLERQAGRWRKQLERYTAHAGWPGPHSLPDVERVGDWLAAHCPATFSPGILHGDYHLANVMFSNHGPELEAIVDWELAAIGDPLIDLGWVLTTLPRAGDPNLYADRAVGWVPRCRRTAGLLQARDPAGGYLRPRPRWQGRCGVGRTLPPARGRAARTCCCASLGGELRGKSV